MEDAEIMRILILLLLLSPPASANLSSEALAKEEATAGRQDSPTQTERSTLLKALDDEGSSKRREAFDKLTAEPA